MINDSQHVATKRALANLRRKGVVAAHRDMGVTPDGRKTDRALAAETGVSVSTIRRVREKHGEHYANAERCCLWSLIESPALPDRVSCRPCRCASQVRTGPQLICERAVVLFAAGLNIAFKPLADRKTRAGHGLKLSGN